MDSVYYIGEGENEKEKEEEVEKEEGEGLEKCEWIWGNLRGRPRE